MSDSGSSDKPLHETKNLSKAAKRRAYDTISQLASEGPRPLVLRFERFDPNGPLDHVVCRIELLLDVVYKAIREPTRLYGITLRKSARILLDFSPAVKTTCYKMIVAFDGESSDDAKKSFSQPWAFTARRAIDILREMQSYAKWQSAVLDVHSRISLGDDTAWESLPAVRPRRFFTTYIKPLFGDDTVTVWKDLTAARERRDTINEISSEVSDLQTVIEEVGETLQQRVTQESDT